MEKLIAVTHWTESLRPWWMVEMIKITWSALEILHIIVT